MDIRSERVCNSSRYLPYSQTTDARTFDVLSTCQHRTPHHSETHQTQPVSQWVFKTMRIFLQKRIWYIIESASYPHSPSSRALSHRLFWSEWSWRWTKSGRQHPCISWHPLDAHVLQHPQQTRESTQNLLPLALTRLPWSTKSACWRLKTHHIITKATLYSDTVLVVVSQWCFKQSR